MRVLDIFEESSNLYDFLQKVEEQIPPPPDYEIDLRSHSKVVLGYVLRRRNGYWIVTWSEDKREIGKKFNSLVEAIRSSWNPYELAKKIVAEILFASGIDPREFGLKRDSSFHFKFWEVEK